MTCNSVVRIKLSSKVALIFILIKHLSDRVCFVWCSAASNILMIHQRHFCVCISKDSAEAIAADIFFTLMLASN